MLAWCWMLWWPWWPDPSFHQGWAQADECHLTMADILTRLGVSVGTDQPIPDHCPDHQRHGSVRGHIDHVYWSLSSLLSSDDGREGSQCTVLSVNVMQSVMQHITAGTLSLASDHPRPPPPALYTALPAPRGRGNLNIPNWFPASHSVCFNYSPSSGPILNCINFKFSI